jgi:hypothetical protein
MSRLRLATDRLMRAGSDFERDLATRWVTAWAGAIGEFQFSAVAKEHFGRRKRGATGRNCEEDFSIHPDWQLHNSISPRSVESKYTLENLIGTRLRSDDDGASNETTEQALTVLAVQIKQLVQNRSLDSRFAAKLVKRLKKEADAISKNGSATKLGQKELKKAFEAVEAVLLGHDAALLVNANAALRETDATITTRKSPQRPTEG